LSKYAVQRTGDKGVMTATLLHVFSSFAVGGQQTRFATVANRLGSAFRHRLVSLDGDTAAVALLDRAVDFAVLPASPERGGPLGRLWRIAAAARPIAADAMVTYNWAAIEWAAANRLLLRLPHIHLEDGFGPEEADRQIWRRAAFRRLMLRRSEIVVPSHRLVDIARTTWYLDPGRIHYIANGIDPGRFDGIAQTGAPFFQRRPGDCVIGAFSPLRAEKNIGRLLRAVARMPAAGVPVRLVVCGGGPERPALERLAGELGIAGRTAFTGHVPKPEAVMGAFDIFAMTSDTEQMPYAVVEAMAARLPVAATDVGDIAMMVASDNRRFIVPRDSPDALVAALGQLCGDAGLRRRLGEANRARVEERFSLPPMVEAFRRVLAAAIAR
jgi:glycosyltransferase involved in cell wall biosynthesis